MALMQQPDISMVKTKSMHFSQGCTVWFTPQASYTAIDTVSGVL